MNKVAKLTQWAGERGLTWMMLKSLHSGALRVIDTLERTLIQLEKRRFLVGEGTISSRKHTAQQNRQIWNNWDWSQGGEEWTAEAQEFRGMDPERWKQNLIDGMMRKYLRPGSTIMEIGPGAGRWTGTLREFAGYLIVADISERCLAICSERFGRGPEVEYLLLSEQGLGVLGPASIDGVWSYDVFVHINPTDIDRYIAGLARALRPGGVAVIHHSGTYQSHAEARDWFRSHVDGALFAHLVTKHGLTLIEQDATLPHKPGDIISVFQKHPVP